MAPTFLLASLAVTTLLPWTCVATQPKAIALDFVKEKRTVPEIARRDGIVPVTLQNARLSYLLDVSVGTPPQTVRVLLDTGSADTWVPSINETLCLAKPIDCQNTGAYDLTQSTTVVRSNQTFNASYGTAFDNGSGAQGIFVIDSFGIGGYELGGVQFAVVEKRTPNVDIGTATGLGIDTRGLLGVGPESSQAGVAQGITTRYPTIVSAMKDQGKIGSNAFSLYLNSLDASYGTIVFGGVDSTKYKGSLVALPIVDNPLAQRAIQQFYSVQLTQLTAQTPSGIFSITPPNNTDPVWTILDSGAPLIYLPDHFLPPLYEYLGVTFATNIAQPVVPCNLSTAEIVFSFYFGGPGGAKINVPMGELIIPQTPIEVGATYADGTPYCVLGIGPSHSFQALLGDPFLRSAYVVYDNDNRQIAIAEANHESTAEPNIQEIAPGAQGIPGVSTIAATLPFNTTSVTAGAAPLPELRAQPNLPINFTLTTFPRPGNVTAMGVEGAMYTATGYVVPSGTGSVNSQTSISPPMSFEAAAFPKPGNVTATGVEGAMYTATGYVGSNGTGSVNSQTSISPPMSFEAAAFPKPGNVTATGVERAMYTATGYVSPNGTGSVRSQTSISPPVSFEGAAQ